MVYSIDMVFKMIYHNNKERNERYDKNCGRK